MFVMDVCDCREGRGWLVEGGGLRVFATWMGGEGGVVSWRWLDGSAGPRR